MAESGSGSHFTPLFGKAINQVNELISIATGYVGDFCVLGCDGTADNTGKLDRVIRLFGLTRRKASTLVCLQDLHADELSHESSENWTVGQPGRSPSLQGLRHRGGRGGRVPPPFLRVRGIIPPFSGK